MGNDSDWHRGLRDHYLRAFSLPSHLQNEDLHRFYDVQQGISLGK